MASILIKNIQQLVGTQSIERLKGKAMASLPSINNAFLFQKKRMNRLEVLVIPGNEKSRNVPLRLGFQSDGVLRKALQMYGSFHDVEVLSLLKDEWTATKRK